MDPNQSLFCEGCGSLLELIDPSERCPSCFSLDYEQGTKSCSACAEQISLFHHMGAAFDYMGPAASLIRQLKYGDQPHLARGAGAFLVAQLDRLGWPLPDILVPVPLSFTHWIERGYNQSEALAESMSSFLQIPVWNVLKRASGDYSQAGLRLSQRRELKASGFRCRKHYDIKDKQVLLIDDVMTTGSTLQRCAEVLLEGFPGGLYALTFCRSVHNS